MIDALFSGHLNWQTPLWLWATLLPVLIWAMLKLFHHRQKQAYADPHLWPWVQAEEAAVPDLLQRGRLPAVTRFLTRLISPSKFVAIAWVSLMIALAGPRSLDQAVTQSSRDGVDVMITMDLSRSMEAKDVKPNRFVFSKSLVESVMHKLEQQDRVALHVFAGLPHVVVPLSHDKQVVEQALQKVYPGLLPIEGSWIEQALVHDLNVLTQTARAAKVLVVFTDGAPPFWNAVEMPDRFKRVAAYEKRAQSETGIKVIYVGVGLVKPTTIPDASHASGMLHADGIKVLNRLEEAQLKKFVLQTEGVYLRADGSADFLQRLMHEITSASDSVTGEESIAVWHDYWQPFVGIALLSLLMAFYGVSLLHNAVNMATMAVRRASHTLKSLSSLLWVNVIAMAVVAPLSEEVMADTTQHRLQQAHGAFESKEFDRAEALYDLVTDYRGFFGAGASVYRLGELDTAVLYFRQAAWQAGNDAQRARALFNLGNSYFQSNLLPQAIAAYQEALKYKTPYSQAAHNLELAENRLKQELAGKRQNPQQGDGEGEGSQGRDDQGAFYGGQKPSSESPESGVGADGDSEDGNRHGEQVNLPNAEDFTDYRLNPSVAKLRLHDAQYEDMNPVLRRQRQQERAEKFEHQLQQLDDAQSELYRRLFEREAGFEAVQTQSHPIPGVQPW